ncbi:hypothetical protein JVU11DRAFT_9078 [Chiua virens]|nr:hypothetical protein JVU11DRAFT_9078 [Chiua virens]
MSGRTKHATSAPVNRKTGPLTIDASHVAAVHTYLAFAAFISALLLGCALHSEKIVENGIAGYPEEWFPSVSATIGDCGPRLALVFLQYFITCTSHSTLPAWLYLAGIVRTLACGGWVYITSTDNHDAHDVLVVLYIMCNLPWMLEPRLSKEETAIRLYSLLCVYHPPRVLFHTTQGTENTRGIYPLRLLRMGTCLLGRALRLNLGGSLQTLQPAGKFAIGVSLDSSIEHKNMYYRPHHLVSRPQSHDDKSTESTAKVLSKSADAKTPAPASDESKSGGAAYSGWR